MESIITYTSYDKEFTSENTSDVQNYELEIINKHKVYTSQDSSFSVFKVDNEPFFKCLMENLGSHCTETINPPCYVVWEPRANNKSGTFTSLETYKKSEEWTDKLLADFEFARAERLSDVLEELVTKVETITVKYKEPEYRWAITYSAGDPIGVREYYIWGKELVSGKTLQNWVARWEEEDTSIMKHSILASFNTKEEALAALPEYENRWAFAG